MEFSYPGLPGYFVGLMPINLFGFQNRKDNGTSIREGLGVDTELMIFGTNADGSRYTVVGREALTEMLYAITTVLLGAMLVVAGHGYVMRMLAYRQWKRRLDRYS